MNDDFEVTFEDEDEETSKIRAILDSQKPWYEQHWEGDDTPLLRSLAR